MKPLRNPFIFLMITTTLCSMGCSYFNAMVRSVEKKIVPAEQHRGADILADAKEAQQAENFAQAESYYNEYLEKNKRQADSIEVAFVYSQLGVLAIRRNDFEAGNRYFEESLRHNPSDMEVYGKYGESLFFHQKNYARAEALFRQAMVSAPDDPRFQLQLGRTLAHQKKYQAGLRYLKMSLGEQQAYDEMAQIYHQHGDYERAALAMTKAHEVKVGKQRLARNEDVQNGLVVGTPTHDQRQEHANALQQVVRQQPVSTQAMPQPSYAAPGYGMGPNDGFASSRPQTSPAGVQQPMIQQQPMPTAVQQQPTVPVQATPMPQQAPMQQVLVQQTHVPYPQQYLTQHPTAPLTYTAQVSPHNGAFQQPNSQPYAAPYSPDMSGQPVMQAPNGNWNTNSPYQQTTQPVQASPHGQPSQYPGTNPALPPVEQVSLQALQGQSSQGIVMSNAPPATAGATQNQVQTVAMAAPINPLSVKMDYGQAPNANANVAATASSTTAGNVPLNPPPFYGFQSF